MTAEENFRRLQAQAAGLDPRRDVEFLGHRYQLVSAGLIPLLTYANATVNATGDNQHSLMAATYQFLADTIQAWTAFQEAALTGKVSQDQVIATVARVAEVLTARPSHAGLRLIGWAAANLGEVDGQLLRAGGQSLAYLSPRQVCNLALAILLDGRDEEQRAEFLEDLNAPEDAEKQALNLALAMIKDKEAKEKASQPAAEPTLGGG